jgi:site-specific recombinase XerD
MIDEFTIATIKPDIVTPMIHGVTWNTLTDTFLQDYRGATQRTYRDAWTRFMNYCGITCDAPVHDVPDEDTLKAFRDSIIDSGRSPNTINAYLSGVRAFYRFLHGYTRKALRTGLITPSRATELQLLIEGVLAIQNVRTGKLPGRLPTTVDQSRDLLDSIPAVTLSDIRDRAMIALLVGCGLRRIELVRANRADIVNQGGQLLLKIQQKGHLSRDSFVVLYSGVERIIRPWINQSPFRQSDNPLFPSLSKRDSGSRLTPRSVSRIIRHRFDAIGLSDHSTHSLRHAFATIALSSDDVDIRDVQQALGHSQITTTERYIHQSNRLAGKPEKAVNDAVFTDTIL